MLGGGVRRITWMLMGILLTIAFLGEKSFDLRPKTEYAHTQLRQQFPEVIAPTGVLADVFETTRSATLRIESRSESLTVGGPLGVGSAFFISEDGLIVTAYHVVDDTEVNRRFRGDIEYVAVTPDEVEYELELVGFDAYLDLAVLQAKIDGPVDYLPLAAAVPEVGSEIVAIGNSRDSFLEARAGNVIEIGVESPRASFAENTIQLTAALAPGDSGGPVINEAGEVVGVVSYIALNGANQGLEDLDIPDYLKGYIGGEPSFASFASPVLANDEVISGLMAGERRDVPVIGFTALFDYIPRLAGQNLRGAVYPDLGRRPGVVIAGVQSGGPAERAGLRASQQQGTSISSADVITHVDGEPARDFYELLELLYIKGVGETVTVTVQRGDETFKVRLELGAKRDVFRVGL